MILFIAIAAIIWIGSGWLSLIPAIDWHKRTGEVWDDEDTKTLFMLGIITGPIMLVIVSAIWLFSFLRVRYLFKRVHQFVRWYGDKVGADVL